MNVVVSSGMDGALSPSRAGIHVAGGAADGRSLAARARLRDPARRHRRHPLPIPAAGREALVFH